MSRLIALTAAAVLVLVPAWRSPSASQSTAPALHEEPACQALQPASTGGPRPRNPDVIVLRFLGVANYELAFRDQVVLFDAGIDLLSWWEPNGVAPGTMTKVDAILIGHAHGEHVWDAPAIAERTGARVVADPIAMRWIRGTGRVPLARLAEVKGQGGDTFTFDGFSVEAVLGHHNVVPDDYMRKDRAAAAAVTLRGGLTPAEQEHDRRLAAMVPTTAEERQRLVTEGTIAYVLRFDNGFTLFYADSAGPVTDAERRIMQGRTQIDVGLIPYYGGELAIPITMEYVRLLRPRVVLPTHHDGHRNRMLDMPMGPLGLAIRAELPQTTAIAPLLRAPVCINTVTRELYLGN